MIAFQCPGCGRRVNAPETAAGKRAKCPGCSAAIAIPAAASAPAEEVIFELPPSAIMPSSPPPLPNVEFTVEPKPVRSPKPSPQNAFSFDSDDEVDEDDRPRSKRRRDDDEDDHNEDDYDEIPRHRGRKRSGGGRMGKLGLARCYKCGADAAERVTFTWWGGIVGPALLTHCRCRRCQATFNGKTGKPNDNAIIVYFVVLFVISLALGILSVVASVR